MGLKSCGRHGVKKVSGWFRMYTESLNDPKVQRLSGEMFKAWINLLCLAKIHDGILPLHEDIAFALRKSPAETTKILDTLIHAGLFEHDETGITPHNWNGRQYKSDVSTERVKRFRKRFEKRDYAVSETPPETDTDTEIKKEEANASSKEKSRRGSRLPEGWTPPLEVLDALKTEGFTDDELFSEMCRFRDYWIAVPGQRGCKLDWSATFRNWMRNARERSRGGGKAAAGNGAGKRPSGGGLVGAGLRRAAALYAVEDNKPGGPRGGHRSGGNGHSAPAGGTELEPGEEDHRGANDPFGGGYGGGLLD